ncbi:MAG: major capsid protein [Microviridae sp.]|nr:MAG: major capsid protein [Microviridae sp.]
MKTTIGGDRLGSGSKMETSMKNYSRSTHDLSFLFRSSMSSGTLVPFLNVLALPGDSFDINLYADVKTLPTIGPLFGSYKVQLDVFEVPMRIYNAMVHQNKLGIGMDMSKVFLPQIEVWANADPAFIPEYSDNEQINPSSLLKYLGISGVGKPTGMASNTIIKREFNAVPFLAYWDIYKNYYANKQEERGYAIHTDDTTMAGLMAPISAKVYSNTGTYKFSMFGVSQTVLATDILVIGFKLGAPIPDETTIQTGLSTWATTYAWNDFNSLTGVPGYKLLNMIQLDRECLICTGLTAGAHTITNAAATPKYQSSTVISLKSFQLSVIDDMKDKILRHAAAGAFVLNGTTATQFPYSGHMLYTGTTGKRKFSPWYSQEQLAIKTYQSDLFNNWLSTAWIEGANSINDITSVSTVGDEFTIDSLNLAQKVYIMLNRIAISGGSYDDWLDAVYTHERVKSSESPIYHGSLIKELSFEEVISTSQDTQGNPLGTLAGRGRLTSKNKGGKMSIRVNEPSYIMGIVSITPKVDYSQGNAWDVNLKTFNDFHKPALDAIGFQDLDAELMVWSSTVYDNTTKVLTKKVLGKQPAWINYMTAVNKTFGNFAESSKEMFMTLNRRYTIDAVNGGMTDATTYIDPTKFNQIFADTNLDAQNFWTQIACDITARRKMSAKIIPNL